RGEQAPGGGGRDRPGRGEVKEVGQVGEVDSVMQPRGAGVLQRDPGRDQLGGWRARRRPGAHRALSASATTSSSPPVCQNTAGPVPGPLASSDSAFAVETGSTISPSLPIPSSAAALPPAAGRPCPG